MMVIQDGDREVEVVCLVNGNGYIRVGGACENRSIFVLPKMTAFEASILAKQLMAAAEESDIR